MHPHVHGQLGDLGGFSSHFYFCNLQCKQYWWGPNIDTPTLKFIIPMHSHGGEQLGECSLHVYVFQQYWWELDIDGECSLHVYVFQQYWWERDIDGLKLLQLKISTRCLLICMLGRAYLGNHHHRTALQIWRVKQHTEDNISFNHDLDPWTKRNILLQRRW